MGKTIESVEQWHMPNQVLQTQTALRITGLNELVTTQQILQCLDPATKINVDCIQKGPHGDFFILLNPDIQRVSFPNDKLKQFKTPKSSLIIQPHHFGHESSIYRKFNPYTCPNSHDTPLKLTSRSVHEWHTAG
jgi:hypothetical protein